MIIGLLGRSRVGKDTAAAAIIDVLGNQHATIERLSQPLKDAVCGLYGFTGDQVETEQKEVVDPRYGCTPRVCIQRLCDHIMGMHGVDFFSRKLFQRYDVALSAQRKCIVIPDIRYEHDIREIQNRGGFVIKIERPVHMGVPLHPWEAHIDALAGTYTVVNDSDVNALREKISQILCSSGLA